MAKNKKKFEVGSADPKPSKTSILSNGQAYDRDVLYSSLSLADFVVAATNRPSQTAFFRAKIDVALRDAYATVVGVDALDPSGHDANLHEDAAFTRGLFGLKTNQGGGGFRPYSKRINFLNCMSNILPQILDMVPKEGDPKRGLWTSLTERLDRPEFVRRSEQSYAVGTIFLQQEKPHRAEA
jgi:hypothetical protein